MPSWSLNDYNASPETYMGGWVPEGFDQEQLSQMMSGSLQGTTYSDDPDNQYYSPNASALNSILKGDPVSQGWFKRWGQGGNSEQLLVNPNGTTSNYAYHVNDDTPFWIGANIAGSIINPLGGSAAGGAAGGLGGYLAEGATAKAINAGLSGAMSSGVEGNPLTGGVMGGLNGYAPNFAGYLGVENPGLTSAINGGIGSGVSAAVNKGNVGKSIATGAIPGLAEYAGGLMSGSPYENPFGQNYSRVPGATQSAVGDITGRSPQMSFAPWAGNSSSMVSIPNVSDEKQGLFESQGLNDFFTGLKGLLPQDTKGWGDAAQGLLGIYSGYKRRQAANSVLNGLTDRRGAYSTDLQRSLLRRDAASGRRSNYAGRDVELQAKLAELDSRNAPLIAQLNNVSTNGLLDMFKSGMGYGARQGWFGDRYNPDVGPQLPQAPAPTGMGAFTLGNMGSNYLTGSYGAGAQTPENPFSIADLINKRGRVYGGM